MAEPESRTHTLEFIPWVSPRFVQSSKTQTSCLPRLRTKNTIARLEISPSRFPSSPMSKVMSIQPVWTSHLTQDSQECAVLSLGIKAN